MKRLRQLGIWAAQRRHWMAVVLLGVFLSVFTLTLSEAWHRAVHAHACEPTHQCAVTMLHGGQVEALVVMVTPVYAGAEILSVFLSKIIFVSSVDFFLPPSCGPPALLS